MTPMGRLRAPLVAAAAGTVLALAVATPAAAKTVYDDRVGLVTGYYANSSQGGPKYYGVKQPSYSHCVWVQRKTLSTGVWTVDGVYDPSHCSPTSAESWQIRDAGYISNTTAIRLYRPTTGGFVVLCVHKSGCLAL